MTQFIDTLVGIFQSSGFARFGEPGGYLYAVMICVGCFLLYLAIVKEFEPLILLPMAFGMILANLPGSGVIHMQYFVGDGLEHPMWVEILNNGGLADMLYMGVKLGIYPPLIFLGIGTMTDFAPLISNPKSLLLGAAAQFGIFGTYMGARLLAATGLVDFTQKQSAAIAIIGGADGPTAIFVTSRLAPELLGSIAVAAYSYMALVPVIQPPIMKALTTKKERTVVMKQLRTVSKTERVIFPIMVTIIVSLIVPDAAVLVGMLMLGNLMKECGVVDRIQKTAGNELMNIITIFLGFSVGCTTNAATFLNIQTVEIIVLGIVAFGVGTAGGVILGKIMCVITHGKINPLIGSAGVSAVPWADVSRYCSLKTTPIHDNYFFVDDMIEKPKKGQEFSNYSILGRVLLTPEIYDILARTKPGAGGEIQLTDAMAEYARNYGGMTAVEFTGKHYDMGNKLKVAEAQVELALQHPEIGGAFRAYLKEFCKTL